MDRYIEDKEKVEEPGCRKGRKTCSVDMSIALRHISGLNVPV